MDNVAKVAEMISWLEEHAEKFPVQFKLTNCETVLDAKKVLDVEIATLKQYREDKNYGFGCRTAYYRANRLKNWLESQK